MDNNAPYDRSDSNARIHLLDLLRALALLAILLAHAHDHFNLYVYPVEEGAIAVLNRAADWFHLHFLTGKAFMLFAFLFGISFFIQLDRSEARGRDFRKRFAGRLGLLYLFGVLHTVFYDGDILTMFAMQGLLLIPLYKVAPRWLPAIGLGFLLCLPLATFLLKWIFDTPYLCSYQWENTGADRNDVFLSGSFAEVAEWNFLYGQTSKWKYVIESGRIGQTFGLFVLGLWLGKRRIFENPAANRPFFMRMLAVCVPLWLLGALAGWATGVPALDAFCLVISNLGFIGAFVAAFAMAASSAWAGALIRLLAPVGRTTLTMYILQSVVFTFFFYGWGLAMATRLGAFASMAAGLALFALQAALAGFWLRHLRYGPLEWLWRSGTHGAWQPLRRRHH